MEKRLRKYSILAQNLVMLDFVTEYTYFFSHGLYCSAIIIVIIIIIIIIIMMF
jgi:hypothetical protein